MMIMDVRRRFTAHGSICCVCLAVNIFAVTISMAQTVFRRSLERVSSLDPVAASSVYASRAVALVYEGLVEYDYTARPYRLIPGLASALPEVSSNGLVYIFHLDPRARFMPDQCFGSNPDGQPRSRAVGAADVVFSLKRLADRKLASSGAWLVEDEIVGMRAFAERSVGHMPTDYALDVAGLRVMDAHTIRIELTQPDPDFPWLMAMPYAVIVPSEAVAYYGKTFGDHPVGSGAYRLQRWRRNYEMVFSRDPAWRGWDRMSNVLLEQPEGIAYERINYLTMDDASTQWLAFLAGELDFLGEISRDNWDAVIDASGQLAPPLIQRGFQLFSMPTLEVAYIGFNMEDPVIGHNTALRQALNCALDDVRWEAFYNGRVTRADGPVPPGVAGRLEAPFAYRFDLARAGDLLRQAGYPGGRDPHTGRRLVLTLDLGRTTQDIRESTELMVAFFNRIGIDLQPRYHSWPTFLEKLARRESQMFRIGWVGDYPGALNFLQLFVGRLASPGPNRCNYGNPAFDQLYEEARATVDDARRLELCRQMQVIIRTDCPWLFIHFPRAYSLTGPKVRNYYPHDFPYGMEKYLRKAP